MPTTFNQPPLYLMEALSLARSGQLVALFGVEVPLEVVERCFRLVTRFGRDPLDLSLIHI